MTQNTNTETNRQESNAPTHRVTWRSKQREGKYATPAPVEISGAWENSAGGISFPFGNGTLTVWPRKSKDNQEDNGGR